MVRPFYLASSTVYETNLTLIPNLTDNEIAIMELGGNY